MSFGSMDIPLWMDMRKFRALSGRLAEEGTTVELEAARLLEQLYVQKVPQEQREEIKADIELERRLDEERDRANRRFCAIRKVKGGEAQCFASERGDFFALARMVRTLVTNHRDDVHLPTHITDAEPIDDDAYRTRMREYQAAPKVTGVYEVDMDQRTLSELQDGEWHSYPMDRVSVAVWKTDRKRHRVNSTFRLNQLYQHLAPHLTVYAADELHQTPETRPEPDLSL